MDNSLIEYFGNNELGFFIGGPLAMVGAMFLAQRLRLGIPLTAAFSFVCGILGFVGSAWLVYGPPLGQ